MRKGMLMLMVGSSGSGKNTIINNLIERRKDVKFLVSNTTREMRPNEKNGVTYNFISTQEFEQLISKGEMLEYDYTHKGYYGISKGVVDEFLQQSPVVVKDISVAGVVNVRKQLAHRLNVTSIFLTQNKKVLRERLIKRGEKNYKLRLKIYDKEQSQMGVCDFIIKNNTIEDTLQKVDAIINHGDKTYPFLPYKTFKRVKGHKVRSYAKKLEKGKKLAPIKIALIDGNIYLLDRVEKYLASILTNKLWTKRFCDAKYGSHVHTEEELRAWVEAIKKYVK